MGIACLAINISYVRFDLAKYVVEIFKDGVINEGNEVKVKRTKLCRILNVRAWLDNKNKIFNIEFSLN